MTFKYLVQNNLIYSLVWLKGWAFREGGRASEKFLLCFPLTGTVSPAGVPGQATTEKWQ